MFSWLARVRGGRRLGILLVVAAFLLGIAAAPATAQSDKRVVKVMTYNMDAGTDFLFFLTGTDLGVAFQETYAELAATDFAGRAAALAQALEDEKPYLVSLQEATLWEFVDNTGARTSLIADQLELLVAAVKERHLPYTVVAVQPLTNLFLPVPDLGVNFHFLDRNIVLARTDLSQADLAVSNVKMATFGTFTEPIPGFIQINGWISVDAKIRGKSARFFATHLMSATSLNDPFQPAQGTELIEIMQRSPFPVVLAGDLNSDASGCGAPFNPLDQTPTAQNIVAAGFDDAWTATPRQPCDGLTWPLFLEDINAGQPVQPFERIDLIFEKGFEVLAARVVGTETPYPSDHAGVVATLLIEK